jgi:hypothetical protein
MVRFKNKEIFGDTFDAYRIKANGHLFNMILDKRIDKNGYINKGDLSELWSYIYILYLNNRTFDVFDKMRGRRGRLQERATAKRFIKVVLDYTQETKITEKVLINFINNIIKTRNPVNPVLNYVSDNKIIKTSIKTNCNLIEELVKGSSITEVIANYKKMQNELKYIRDILKKEVTNTNSDDIVTLIQAIKRHKITPANNTSNCDNILQSLKVIIYAKLCLLKYVSLIIGEKDTITNCKPLNVSRQIDMFSRLSPEFKNHYKKIYDETKAKIINYKIQIEQLTKCDAKTLKLKEDIESITQDLTNIYEDLFGSVRCFIRVRPLNQMLDNLDEAKHIKINIVKNTEISMKCRNENMFNLTEFFGVFGPELSNLEIYTGDSNDVFDINGLEVRLKDGKQLTDVSSYALYKTFQQLESGYSIIFSAYGLSGSGKTSTYLGFNDNYGLLHYGLRNLQGVDEICLHQAFELYYNFISPNDLTIQNRIILLYDSSKSFESDISKYGIDKHEITHEPLKFEKTCIHDVKAIPDYIKNITDTCQNNMKQNSRIKRTPLNNQSSRSHLFLIFKIKFNNTTGYLTFSDQAGFENAYSIYNKIFTKNNSLPYLFRQFDATGRFKGESKKTLSYYLKCDDFGITNYNQLLINEGPLKFNKDPIIENTLMKNIQILFESFSIVESLLHMKYFLNRRNGINKTFLAQKIERGDLNYDTTKVFKSPQLEDVFHPSYIKNKASKVRCLMVPVLNYLDNFSKDKLTKFVMFTALRQDKCSENKDSLEFAAGINSVSKIKKE